MAEMRVCKQCGDEKPLTKENFRQYKGKNSMRYYKACLECERINNQYKYLTNKAEPTEDDKEHIGIIDRYYNCLSEAGFAPPRRTGKAVVEAKITAKLAELEAKQAELEEVLLQAGIEIPTDTPQKLLNCLGMELTQEPEYYQDVLYFSLLNEYAPVIGMDDNLLPEREPKYLKILQYLGDKFDDYEEEYYNMDC